MYRTCITLFFLLLVVSKGFGEEIRVSAAASMGDCVQEIISVYHSRKVEVKIISQFASSGNLAKQIMHGAPVDIYISANEKWMNYLIQEGKIERGSKVYLARNRLVFVRSGHSDTTELRELDKLGLIGMGSPRSVPAGQYAAQALKKADMLEILQKKKKIVLAKDVRQALRYAELNEVDGAFVYKTDALSSKLVIINILVDQKMHDPILYPAGLTRRGENNGAAQQFMEFLQQEEVQRIFTRYGFEPF